MSSGKLFDLGENLLRAVHDACQNRTNVGGIRETLTNYKPFLLTPFYNSSNNSTIRSEIEYVDNVDYRIPANLRDSLNDFIRDAKISKTTAIRYCLHAASRLRIHAIAVAKLRRERALEEIHEYKEKIEALYSNISQSNLQSNSNINSSNIIIPNDTNAVPNSQLNPTFQQQQTGQGQSQAHLQAAQATITRNLLSISRDISSLSQVNSTTESIFAYILTYIPLSLLMSYTYECYHTRHSNITRALLDLVLLYKQERQKLSEAGLLYLEPRNKNANIISRIKLNSTKDAIEKENNDSYEKKNNDNYEKKNNNRKNTSDEEDNDEEDSDRSDEEDEHTSDEEEEEEEEEKNEENDEPTENNEDNSRIPIPNIHDRTSLSDVGNSVNPNAFYYKPVSVSAPFDLVIQQDIIQSQKSNSLSIFIVEFMHDIITPKFIGELLSEVESRLFIHNYDTKTDSKAILRSRIAANRVNYETETIRVLELLYVCCSLDFGVNISTARFRRFFRILNDLSSTMSKPTDGIPSFSDTVAPSQSTLSSLLHDAMDVMTTDGDKDKEVIVKDIKDSKEYSEDEKKASNFVNSPEDVSSYRYDVCMLLTYIIQVIFQSKLQRMKYITAYSDNVSSTDFQDYINTFNTATLESTSNNVIGGYQDMSNPNSKSGTFCSYGLGSKSDQTSLVNFINTVFFDIKSMSDTSIPFRDGLFLSFAAFLTRVQPFLPQDKRLEASVMSGIVILVLSGPYLRMITSTSLYKFQHLDTKNTSPYGSLSQATSTGRADAITIQENSIHYQGGNNSNGSNKIAQTFDEIEALRAAEYDEFCNLDSTINSETIHSKSSELFQLYCDLQTLGLRTRLQGATTGSKDGPYSISQGSLDSLDNLCSTCQCILEDTIESKGILKLQDINTVIEPDDYIDSINANLSILNSLYNTNTPASNASTTNPNTVHNINNNSITGAVKNTNVIIKREKHVKCTCTNRIQSKVVQIPVTTPCLTNSAVAEHIIQSFGTLLLEIIECFQHDLSKLFTESQLAMTAFLPLSLYLHGGIPSLLISNTSTYLSTNSGSNANVNANISSSSTAVTNSTSASASSSYNTSPAMMLTHQSSFAHWFFTTISLIFKTGVPIMSAFRSSLTFSVLIKNCIQIDFLKHDSLVTYYDLLQQHGLTQGISTNDNDYLGEDGMNPAILSGGLLRPSDPISTQNTSNSNSISKSTSMSNVSSLFPAFDRAFSSTGPGSFPYERSANTSGNMNMGGMSGIGGTGGSSSTFSGLETSMNDTQVYFGVMVPMQSSLFPSLSQLLQSLCYDSTAATEILACLQSSKHLCVANIIRTLQHALNSLSSMQMNLLTAQKQQEEFEQQQQQQQSQNIYTNTSSTSMSSDDSAILNNTNITIDDTLATTILSLVRLLTGLSKSRLVQQQIMTNSISSYVNELLSYNVPISQAYYDIIQKYTVQSDANSPASGKDSNNAKNNINMGMNMSMNKMKNMNRDLDLDINPTQGYKQKKKQSKYGYSQFLHSNTDTNHVSGVGATEDGSINTSSNYNTSTCPENLIQTDIIELLLKFLSYHSSITFKANIFDSIASIIANCCQFYENSQDVFSPSAVAAIGMSGAASSSFTANPSQSAINVQTNANMSPLISNFIYCVWVVMSTLRLIDPKTANLVPSMSLLTKQYLTSITSSIPTNASTISSVTARSHLQQNQQHMHDHNITSDTIPCKIASQCVADEPTIAPKVHSRYGLENDIVSYELARFFATPHTQTIAKSLTSTNKKNAKALDKKDLDDKKDDKDKDDTNKNVTVTSASTDLESNPIPYTLSQTLSPSQLQVMKATSIKSEAEAKLAQKHRVRSLHAAASESDGCVLPLTVSFTRLIMTLVHAMPISEIMQQPFSPWFKDYNLQLITEASQIATQTQAQAQGPQVGQHSNRGFGFHTGIHSLRNPTSASAASSTTSRTIYFTEEGSVTSPLQYVQFIRSHILSVLATTNASIPPRWTNDINSTLDDVTSTRPMSMSGRHSHLGTSSFDSLYDKSTVTSMLANKSRVDPALNGYFSNSYWTLYDLCMGIVDNVISIGTRDTESLQIQGTNMQDSAVLRNKNGTFTVSNNTLAAPLIFSSFYGPIGKILAANLGISEYIGYNNINTTSTSTSNLGVSIPSVRGATMNTNARSLPMASTSVTTSPAISPYLLSTTTSPCRIVCHISTSHLSKYVDIREVVYVDMVDSFITHKNQGLLNGVIYTLVARAAPLLLQVTGIEKMDNLSEYLHIEKTAPKDVSANVNVDSFLTQSGGPASVTSDMPTHVHFGEVEKKTLVSKNAPRPRISKSKKHRLLLQEQQSNLSHLYRAELRAGLLWKLRKSVLLAIAGSVDADNTNSDSNINSNMYDNNNNRNNNNGFDDGYYDDDDVDSYFPDDMDILQSSKYANSRGSTVRSSSTSGLNSRTGLNSNISSDSMNSSNSTSMTQALSAALTSRRNLHHYMHEEYNYGLESVHSISTETAFSKLTPFERLIPSNYQLVAPHLYFLVDAVAHGTKTCILESAVHCTLSVLLRLLSQETVFLQSCKKIGIPQDDFMTGCHDYNSTNNSGNNANIHLSRLRRQSTLRSLFYSAHKDESIVLWKLMNYVSSPMSIQYSTRSTIPIAFSSNRLLFTSTQYKSIFAIQDRVRYELAKRTSSIAAVYNAIVSTMQNVPSIQLITGANIRQQQQSQTVAVTSPMENAIVNGSYSVTPPSIIPSSCRSVFVDHLPTSMNTIPLPSLDKYVHMYPNVFANSTTTSGAGTGTGLDDPVSAHSSSILASVQNSKSVALTAYNSVVPIYEEFLKSSFPSTSSPSSLSSLSASLSSIISTIVNGSSDDFLSANPRRISIYIPSLSALTYISTDTYLTILALYQSQSEYSHYSDSNADTDSISLLSTLLLHKLLVEEKNVATGTSSGNNEKLRDKLSDLYNYSKNVHFNHQDGFISTNRLAYDWVFGTKAAHSNSSIIIRAAITSAISMMYIPNSDELPLSALLYDDMMKILQTQVRINTTLEREMLTTASISPKELGTYIEKVYKVAKQGQNESRGIERHQKPRKRLRALRHESDSTYDSNSNPNINITIDDSYSGDSDSVASHRLYDDDVIAQETVYDYQYPQNHLHANADTNGQQIIIPESSYLLEEKGLCLYELFQLICNNENKRTSVELSTNFTLSRLLKYVSYYDACAIQQTTLFDLFYNVLRTSSSKTLLEAASGSGITTATSQGVLPSFVHVIFGFVGLTPQYYRKNTRNRSSGTVLPENRYTHLLGEDVSLAYGMMFTIMNSKDDLSKYGPTGNSRRSADALSAAGRDSISSIDEHREFYEIQDTYKYYSPCNYIHSTHIINSPLQSTRNRTTINTSILNILFSTLQQSTAITTLPMLSSKIVQIFDQLFHAEITQRVFFTYILYEKPFFFMTLLAKLPNNSHGMAELIQLHQKRITNVYRNDSSSQSDNNNNANEDVRDIISDNTSQTTLDLYDVQRPQQVNEVENNGSGDSSICSGYENIRQIDAFSMIDLWNITIPYQISTIRSSLIELISAQLHLTYDTMMKIQSPTQRKKYIPLFDINVFMIFQQAIIRSNKQLTKVNNNSNGSSNIGNNRGAIAVKSDSTSFTQKQADIFRNRLVACEGLLVESVYFLLLRLMDQLPGLSCYNSKHPLSDASIAQSRINIKLNGNIETPDILFFQTLKTSWGSYLVEKKLATPSIVQLQSSISRGLVPKNKQQTDLAPYSSLYMQVLQLYFQRFYNAITTSYSRVVTALRSASNIKTPLMNHSAVVQNKIVYNKNVLSNSPTFDIMYDPMIASATSTSSASTNANSSQMIKNTIFGQTSTIPLLQNILSSSMKYIQNNKKYYNLSHNRGTSSTISTNTFGNFNNTTSGIDSIDSIDNSSSEIPPMHYNTTLSSLFMNILGYIPSYESISISIDTTPSHLILIKWLDGMIIQKRNNNVSTISNVSNTTTNGTRNINTNSVGLVDNNTKSGMIPTCLDVRAHFISSCFDTINMSYEESRPSVTELISFVTQASVSSISMASYHILKGLTLIGVLSYQFIPSNTLSLSKHLSTSATSSMMSDMISDMSIDHMNIVQHQYPSTMLTSTDTIYNTFTYRENASLQVIYTNSILLSRSLVDITNIIVSQFIRYENIKNMIKNMTSTISANADVICNKRLQSNNTTSSGSSILGLDRLYSTDMVSTIYGSNISNLMHANYILYMCERSLITCIELYYTIVASTLTTLKQTLEDSKMMMDQNSIQNNNKNINNNHQSGDNSGNNIASVADNLISNQVYWNLFYALKNNMQIIQFTSFAYISSLYGQEVQKSDGNTNKRPQQQQQQQPSQSDGNQQNTLADGSISAREGQEQAKVHYTSQLTNYTFVTYQHQTVFLSIISTMIQIITTSPEYTDNAVETSSLSQYKGLQSQKQSSQQKNPSDVSNIYSKPSFFKHNTLTLLSECGPLLVTIITNILIATDMIAKSKSLHSIISTQLGKDRLRKNFVFSSEDTMNDGPIITTGGVSQINEITSTNIIDDDGVLLVAKEGIFTSTAALSLLSLLYTHVSELNWSELIISNSGKDIALENEFHSSVFLNFTPGLEIYSCGSLEPFLNSLTSPYLISVLEATISKTNSSVDESSMNEDDELGGIRNTVVYSDEFESFTHSLTILYQNVFDFVTIITKSSSKTTNSTSTSTVTTTIGSKGSSNTKDNSIITDAQNSTAHLYNISITLSPAVQSIFKVIQNAIIQAFANKQFHKTRMSTVIPSTDGFGVGVGVGVGVGIPESSNANVATTTTNSFIEYPKNIITDGIIKTYLPRFALDSLVSCYSKALLSCIETCKSSLDYFSYFCSTISKIVSIYHEYLEESSFFDKYQSMGGATPGDINATTTTRAVKTSTPPIDVLLDDENTYIDILVLQGTIKYTILSIYYAIMQKHVDFITVKMQKAINDMKDSPVEGGNDAITSNTKTTTTTISSTNATAVQRTLHTLEEIKIITNIIDEITSSKIQAIYCRHMEECATISHTPVSYELSQLYIEKYIAEKKKEAKKRERNESAKNISDANNLKDGINAGVISHITSTSVKNIKNEVNREKYYNLLDIYKYTRVNIEKYHTLCQSISRISSNCISSGLATILKMKTFRPQLHSIAMSIPISHSISFSPYVCSVMPSINLTNVLHANISMVLRQYYTIAKLRDCLYSIHDVILGINIDNNGDNGYGFSSSNGPNTMLSSASNDSSDLLTRIMTNVSASFVENGFISENMTTFLTCIFDTLQHDIQVGNFIDTVGVTLNVCIENLSRYSTTEYSTSANVMKFMNSGKNCKTISSIDTGNNVIAKAAVNNPGNISSDASSNANNNYLDVLLSRLNAITKKNTTDYTNSGSPTNSNLISDIMQKYQPTSPDSMTMENESNGSNNNTKTTVNSNKDILTRLSNLTSLTNQGKEKKISTLSDNTSITKSSPTILTNPSDTTIDITELITKATRYSYVGFVSIITTIERMIHVLSNNLPVSSQIIESLLLSIVLSLSYSFQNTEQEQKQNRDNYQQDQNQEVHQHQYYQSNEVRSQIQLQQQIMQRFNTELMKVYHMFSSTSAFNTNVDLHASNVVSSKSFGQRLYEVATQADNEQSYILLKKYIQADTKHKKYNKNYAISSIPILEQIFCLCKIQNIGVSKIVQHTKTLVCLNRPLVDKLPNSSSINQSSSQNMIQHLLAVIAKLIDSQLYNKA